MAKSIDEINDDLAKFNKAYRESGLTDGKINKLLGIQAAAKAGRFKKDESYRDALSKRRKGIKFSEDHKAALRAHNYKHTIPIENILKAQQETATAKEAAKQLNLSFYTYRDICIHHGIYKKEDRGERNKKLTGHSIKCWKYDPDKKDSKGEYVGEFASKNEAAKKVGTFPGVITDVINKKYKQAGGYFFEKA